MKPPRQEVGGFGPETETPRLTRAQLKDLRARATEGPRMTNMVLGLNSRVEEALVKRGLLAHEPHYKLDWQVVITDAGRAALAAHDASKRKPSSTAETAPPRTSLPLTSGVSAARHTGGENR